MIEPLDYNRFVKTLAKQQSFAIAKDVKSIVKKICGIPHGSTYKMSITLAKAINWDDPKEGKDEDAKFKLYVCAADRIIECLKIKYPFINLEGITLDWTVEKIIKVIQDVYKNLPCETLEKLEKDGRIKL
jgi:hypothetical protein